MEKNPNTQSHSNIFNDKEEIKLNMDDGSLLLKNLDAINNILDNQNITLNNSFQNNFIPLLENAESIEQPSYQRDDSQFQSKKKDCLEDMSYFMEQVYDNSQMNIEDDFKNNYSLWTIGNEDQTHGIDPIQEVNEQNNNDSFIHENNFFIHNLNDITNSMEVLNATAPVIEYNNKTDGIREETVWQKIKKNLMNSIYTFVNTSTCNITKNETINNNTTAQNTWSINTNKQIFTVSSDRLNRSCCNKWTLNTSWINKSKRGRKNFLVEGVKTEIMDKKFIREFRKYLNSRINQYKTFLEEDLQFWIEFFQNKNPPFLFTTTKDEKLEFKSYSQNYLSFLFSKNTFRYLYSLFIKDTEKEWKASITLKRNKTLNSQILLYYTIYGRNLHQKYSEECNQNEFNWNEIDMISQDSIKITADTESGNKL